MQHELALITLDKEMSERKSKRIDYNKLIKNVDMKIERILSLYADGKIDRSALDRQISKLNEEKNQLLQDQRNQDAAKKKQITKEELEKYTIDLTRADFETKQAIIQKLIKSITINDKSVSIEWLF